MTSLSNLTEFLGWASIINIAYLLLATVAVTYMRETIVSIHSKMFGIEEKDLGPMYFKFLGNYKIATLVFVVAPYIALKIMG